jgi:hypothetical protein
MSIHSRSHAEDLQNRGLQVRVLPALYEKTLVCRAFRHSGLSPGANAALLVPRLLPDLEQARVGELRFLAERLACQSM